MVSEMSPDTTSVAWPFVRSVLLCPTMEIKCFFCVLLEVQSPIPKEKHQGSTASPTPAANLPSHDNFSLFIQLVLSFLYAQRKGETHKSRKKTYTMTIFNMQLCSQTSQKSKTF